MGSELLRIAEGFSIVAEGLRGLAKAEGGSMKDKDEKGNLVINEAQAAIVRRVFDEFMNGLNPEVIAAELNGEGVPGCMGEPKWAVSTIMHILENEKYKGDALLQKYYTSDFLSKKSVRNMGQIEQVYVKDSHPPIVGKELWEAVQLEIERRRLFREKHNLQNMGRYTDVQPFTCKVICGKCGAVCWRRTWTRGSRKIRVWQCGKRYQQKGVVGCKSGNLYEKDLEKAFLMTPSLGRIIRMAQIKRLLEKSLSN